MAENDNLHTGHRSRMLDKFRNHGIAPFTEHEILEMLLYIIIPRKNTNPIAHCLVKKFGSLKNVFIAPLNKLQEVDGIGERAALQLKLFGAVINLLCQTPAPLNENFSEPEKVTKYYIKYFENKNTEVLSVLLLDDKYTMLNVCETGNNQPNHIEPCLREIIKEIINYDSRKVIIAHNHINGTANPSDDDVRLTREIGEYLKKIDVALVDHIIVSKDNALSLRNQGILSSIWEN